MAFLVILDLDRCILGKFSYILLLIKYHSRRDSRYILSSGSDFNKMIFKNGRNEPPWNVDGQQNDGNQPADDDEPRHERAPRLRPRRLPLATTLPLRFISHEQSDSSVSQKVIFHCGCTKIEISSAISPNIGKIAMLIFIHTRKRCQSSRLQTPSSGDNFRYVPSSFLANELFVSA